MNQENELDEYLKESFGCASEVIEDAVLMWDKLEKSKDFVVDMMEWASFKSLNEDSKICIGLKPCGCLANISLQAAGVPHEDIPNESLDRDSTLYSHKLMLAIDRLRYGFGAPLLKFFGCDEAAAKEFGTISGISKFSPINGDQSNELSFGSAYWARQRASLLDYADYLRDLDL